MIAGAILCLLLYSVLILGETSLLLVRYGKLRRPVLESFKANHQIARLMEQGNQVADALRIGKIFALLGLGALLYGGIVNLCATENAEVATSIWQLLIGVIVSFLILLFLFGELVPRAFALRYPLRSLRLATPLLKGLQLLLFPISFFPLKRKIYGLLDFEAESINPLDTSVQLRAMGEGDTYLSPVIRKIVDRSIHLKELVVHDVLLPRNEVVIYDLNLDAATNLKLMKKAGHTRFPLCNSDLDDCIGIIHIKDIFRSELGECVMDPMVLKRPTTTFLLETPLEEALQRMLRAKIHLGIVYDTFGGALGVVTLERILEELVGDIQDEFDSEEDPITQLVGQEAYRILGQTPIHDLEARLGVVVENDEVSTFGGLITAELGRIPVAGEQLDICNMQIEIVDVDDRRVISTRVRC